jgi:hypothetical protein
VHERTGGFLPPRTVPAMTRARSGPGSATQLAREPLAGKARTQNPAQAARGRQAAPRQEPPLPVRRESAPGRAHSGEHAALAEPPPAQPRRAGPQLHYQQGARPVMPGHTHTATRPAAPPAPRCRSCGTAPAPGPAAARQTGA